MTQPTELTELEGAALSVVQGHGQCTAYRIKRDFAESPSEFWSGSAGAVYPLVKRLVKRGLLRERVDASDGRGKRTLALTDAGRVSLEDWFGDLDRATAPGFDPLRTRLNMRRAVSPDLYRQFLADVETALTHQLDAPQAPPGPDQEWASDLYRLWIESRLEWIAPARAAGLL